MPLLSGGGSNLQSLIDSQKVGYLSEIKLVISNNKMLGRKGQQHRSYLSQQEDYPNNEQYDLKFWSLFKQYKIDLVVLAGYLSM